VLFETFCGSGDELCTDVREKNRGGDKGGAHGVIFAETLDVLRVACGGRDSGGSGETRVSAGYERGGVRIYRLVALSRTSGDELG
jgi:hypothetical protein